MNAERQEPTVHTEPLSAEARDHAYRVWLAALTKAPYRVDYYQALRRIESAHPQLPRLGEALRPIDEPLRLGQPASLDFAPASLHSVVHGRQGVPRLMQRIFGLLGSNGALPLQIGRASCRERV